MEATLSHVVKQTAGLFHKPELVENCKDFSSCDKDAACQLVLKSSEGVMAPMHVHGDLCSMFIASVLRRVTDIQRAFAEEVNQLTRTGMTHRIVVDRLGNEMLDTIDA
eukprot:1125168-Prorocentrum_lima.AAC.1